MALSGGDDSVRATLSPRHGSIEVGHFSKGSRVIKKKKMKDASLFFITLKPRVE